MGARTSVSSWCVKHRCCCCTTRCVWCWSQHLTSAWLHSYAPESASPRSAAFCRVRTQCSSSCPAHTQSPPARLPRRLAPLILGQVSICRQQRGSGALTCQGRVGMTAVGACQPGRVVTEIAGAGHRWHCVCCLPALRHYDSIRHTGDALLSSRGLGTHPLKAPLGAREHTR